MCTVSVIVPSLNQGPYIRNTIASILAQDFADLECIVIDGGSTDETLDILRSIEDPRLNWISEPDRGQSHAINKGVKRSRGRILSYLNSDDVLKSGAVSAAVTFLDAHPEVELVEGDLEFIAAEGRPLGTLPGQPFSLANLLSGSHRFNQAGAFWRRTLTDRIGDFDESLHYCMDHDYWARASLSGASIAYHPGVRASFRLHPGSKTVGQAKGFLADWNAMSLRLEAEYAGDADFVRIVRQSRTSSAWRNAVHFWRQGQVTQVRPQLRRVIFRHPSLKRRVFALLLLVDSWLNSNLAGVTLNCLGRFAFLTDQPDPRQAEIDHMLIGTHSIAPASRIDPDVPAPPPQ